MKNKYLLLAFFILLFLFASSSFALALEITYPQIPGLVAPSPNCSGSGCLSIYISYWFGLAIILSGVLAVISLAVGGVQLIMSAESPENASSAKDRIKGAILGLVLTLASFIIIRTINPVLITPTLTPLPGVAGIFYSIGQSIENLRAVPLEVSNVITGVPEGGYNTIFYKCDSPGPALLIWKFSKENFGTANGYQDAWVNRIECNNFSNIDSLSFKMAFETPGIYYYLDDACAGFSSGAVTSNQDQIDEVFRGKIKSIRFVHNAAIGLYYGVIFHKEIGVANGGQCTYPILPMNNMSTNYCLNKDIYNIPIGNLPASSVEVFKWDTNPASYRDGIDFYSEAFGWSQAAQIRGEGYYNLPSNEIGRGLSKYTKDIVFKYTPDTTQDYKNAFKNFEDKQGSINIKDHYLVGLYSQDALFGGVYCQTFTKDAPNLNLESIIATGSINIGTVQIVPIK
ncbi:MAG: pilin [Patescibacteria group bacterium]